jgi:hypothetical protein
MLGCSTPVVGCVVNTDVDGGGSETRREGDQGWKEKKGESNDNVVAR